VGIIGDLDIARVMMPVRISGAVLCALDFMGQWFWAPGIMVGVFTDPGTGIAGV